MLCVNSKEELVTKTFGTLVHYLDSNKLVLDILLITRATFSIFKIFIGFVHIAVLLSFFTCPFYMSCHLFTCPLFLRLVSVFGCKYNIDSSPSVISECGNL